MSKHNTVKLFKWIEGALQFTEHTFTSVYAAHEFLRHADCHSAKITNVYGEVLHEEVRQPVSTNTYA
jgi:hypothetical protein